MTIWKTTLDAIRRVTDINVTEGSISLASSGVTEASSRTMKLIEVFIDGVDKVKDKNIEKMVILEELLTTDQMKLSIANEFIIEYEFWKEKGTASDASSVAKRKWKAMQEKEEEYSINCIMKMQLEVSIACNIKAIQAIEGKVSVDRECIGVLLRDVMKETLPHNAWDADRDNDFDGTEGTGALPLL